MSRKRKRPFKPISRKKRKIEKEKEKEKKLKFIDKSQEEKLFVFNHIENLKRIDTKIDHFKILEIAIERNYPFAKETKELFNIYRTCEFMRPILIVIQEIYRRNKSFGRIKKNCRIISGELPRSVIKINKIPKKKKVVVVNTKKLFILIHNYILCENTTNSRIMLRELINRNEFNSFIKKMLYHDDVYICLNHIECVHVCLNGFCTRLFNSSGCRKCSTSLKNHELIDMCPPPWARDGVDHSVYNRKRFNRSVFKTFENIKLKYNNKLLDIDMDLIINKLSTLYYDSINFNNLKDFVLGQILMFRNMINDKIFKCEQAYREIVSKRRRKKLINNNTTITTTMGKPRKRKKKARTKIPKKKKNRKRKRRKVIRGRFEKNTKPKIRIHEVPKSVNFKSALKRFENLMKEIKKLEHVRVLEYTHLLRANQYVSEVNKVVLEEREEREEEGKIGENLTDVETLLLKESISASENIIYGPRSCECFYVDPVKTNWKIPYDNVMTEVKKSSLLYMRFFNDPKIQRVLKLDDGNELTLRCKTHKWIEESSDEFIDSIPRIVSFIRRLCPGKARIVMMCKQIQDDCNAKYSQLRSKLKAHHKKNCMVNYSNIESLLEYDYWKNYFHHTVSDEMMLELCEYLYWCKLMCERHPHPKMFGGYGDLTEEIIFIGGLFLLKVGLKYQNTRTIIPKYAPISKRGFLIPQNELGTVLIHRRDASVGITTLTNIMISLCDLTDYSEVAFLEWKSKHGELNNWVKGEREGLSGNSF